MNEVFRNEGMDKANHSPEFTSMECHMAYGNQEDGDGPWSRLYISALMEVNGSPDYIPMKAKLSTLHPPWNKIDMTEFVIKVTGI